MRRIVSGKTAKHIGWVIGAWILLAGCAAMAAYVIDAEYGVRHAPRPATDQDRP
jgi:hypothetical protein